MWKETLPAKELPPLRSEYPVDLGIVEKRSVTVVSEVYYLCPPGEIEGGGVFHRATSDERWIIAGQGTTDADGWREINLRTCLPPNRGFEELGGEPWILATPVSKAPCMLTVIYKLTLLTDLKNKYKGWTSNPYLITMTVFSWSMDGGSAPNVPFAWQCTAKVARR